LAYGVDICAHRACLKKNIETVAIVGHGLDRIYPFVHKNTASEMIEKGAIITEFLSGTEPERQNFVKRNRIIAGMADATIVIESGIKGGALITARMASSYNRDVLAFPGRVTDEYAGGCNWLIKNNIAALIENADDLGNCLGWESTINSNDVVQTKLFHEFKSEEEQIIYQSFIKEREININQLRVLTDLPISKLSPILLGFEFEGLIKSLPGNNYRLI
jgi:DNA processing protein